MAKFQLAPAPTFSAPADIPVPGQGVVQIDATWRHKTREAFLEWTQANAGRPDLDILMDILAGWSDEVDQPFSREALAQMLNAYPGAAMSLLHSYRRGLFEGRVKN